MRLKQLIFTIFFLTILGDLTSAASNISAESISNHTGLNYWSVIQDKSIYDSLKIEVKKASSPIESIALKDYLNALQFREQLQVSDNLPLTFPTSAGIYNGSLASDSLSAYDQLLFLYRNLGDRKGEASVLSSYGTRHAVQGDLDKALSFFHKALQLNKELNDKPAIVKNCFSLARVYKYNGNLEEAVRYNEYIVEIALNTRNNHYLAEAYINLAKLRSGQKNYKDAEVFIMEKALPLYYYGLRDKIGTMNCYDQLAEIYQQQKRYSEAKWFYIQSNMVARKINNPAGIVASLINLAHVKMSIGDHQLALRDFREAETLSISNKYTYKLVEIKSDLSHVYNALGNKIAANLALSEYAVLRDALLRK